MSHRHTTPLVIGGGADPIRLVERLVNCYDRDEVRVLIRHLAQAAESSTLRQYDAAAAIAKGDSSELPAVADNVAKYGTQWVEAKIRALLAFLCDPRILAVLSEASEKLKGSEVGYFLEAAVALLNLFCRHKDKLPSRPAEAEVAVREWAARLDDIEQVAALSNGKFAVYLTAKALARNVMGYAPSAASEGVDHHLAVTTADDSAGRAASDGDVRAALSTLLPRIYATADDNATYWLVACAGATLGTADIGAVLGARTTADPEPRSLERLYLMQRMLRGNPIDSKENGR